MGENAGTQPMSGEPELEHNPETGTESPEVDITVGYHKLSSPVADERRPILISPFIREGDTVLLTGGKGQGKSTMMADVSLAHLLPDSTESSSEALCGVLKVDREVWRDRSICIVDAENDPPEWKDFIRDSLSARGLTHLLDHVTDRLVWTNARQHNWDNLEWLRQWMQSQFIPELLSMNVGLLILDSMHAIWTRELIKPDWVTGGVEPLRATLKNAGITMICLTHTSRDFKDKMESNEFLPYGTVRQDQACDTMIGIKRIPKERRINLRLEKRRAGKWNLEGSKCSLAESPTFGGYQRIIRNDWLHENPKPEPVDNLRLMDLEKSILNEVGEVEFDLGTITGNRKRNKGIVDSLLLGGILEVTGGRGVKGDPVRYRITELGKKALKG